MGFCDYCEQHRMLHGRNHEDHLHFIGHYCDPCLDWIDAKVLMWGYRDSLRYVDFYLRHPLSRLFTDDHLGHLISEYVGGDTVPVDFEEYRRFEWQ